MKWLMNQLRGYVTVTAQGDYPQRLMNLCAQEGVVFWGVQWQGDHLLTLTVRRSSLHHLRQLAERLCCTLTVGQGVGLPFFLGRLRHRYAFLLGLALSVSAVLILSNYVLTIQVVGNQTVATGEILSQLSLLGVKTGVYGKNLDRVTIAQQALLEMDELSFMAINRYGTRIEVIVRERTLPPDLQQTSGLTAIFAEADGIIEEINLLSGERRVEVGTIVAEGDLLISGEVELEPPEYSDQPSQWVEFVALGEVVARTWRTLEGQIPLTTTTKLYTGSESATYSLTILGNSVKFFGSGSILEGECDKIMDISPWVLPWGVSLPIYFTVERSYQYLPQQVTITPQSAQTLLEEELLRQLEDTLGEDGTVISTSYTAEERDGTLYVTLQAQCREEIGVSREMEPTHTEEELGDIPHE